MVAEALNGTGLPIHQTPMPLAVPEPVSSTNRLPRIGWKTTSPGGSLPVDSLKHEAKSDLDDEPAVSASGGGTQGLLGDRLSAYEEYRGFVFATQLGGGALRARLARTHPEIKTFFAVTYANNDPRITALIPAAQQVQVGVGHFSATQLEIIHLFSSDLVAGTAPGESLINHQRAEGHSPLIFDSSGDQAAVPIVFTPAVSTGQPGAAVGLTLALNPSQPMVPTNIERVSIFPDEIQRLREISETEIPLLDFVRKRLSPGREAKVLPAILGLGKWEVIAVRIPRLIKSAT